METKIFAKRGISDFFFQRGGFGKIGEGCFKKWGINYFHTNYAFQVLIFSEYLVCVCVLFICTISISVICILKEELSLITSNQQIYDFTSE